MENKYEPLEPSEVIWIDINPVATALGLSSYFTFLALKVAQFAAMMKFKLGVSDEIKQQIFDDGVECQILRFRAKGWQAGKIRVNLIVEFSPDEFEETQESEEFESSQIENKNNNSETSPLDDLRQKFNQEYKLKKWRLIWKKIFTLKIVMTMM